MGDTEKSLLLAVLLHFGFVELIIKCFESSVKQAGIHYAPNYDYYLEIKTYLYFCQV